MIQHKTSNSQYSIRKQGEIYVFSKDKQWENYEYIMSDIFDHIIASVSFFDLELFELPSEGRNVYL